MSVNISQIISLLQKDDILDKLNVDDEFKNAYKTAKSTNDLHTKKLCYSKMLSKLNPNQLASVKNCFSSLSDLDNDNKEFLKSLGIL